jgi:hypothetical protein
VKQGGVGRYNPMSQQGLSCPDDFASYASVIWLELGASASRIRIERNGATNDLPLPIGTSIVSALFQRDPPRESELEAAIDLIEQAVMPLAKVMPRQAVLVAGNELARNLASASTGSDGSRFALLVAVEARFEQLAQAAGRGMWDRDNRMDSAIAAGLLILREFMHHSGFERIELRESGEGLVHAQ